MASHNAHVKCANDDANNLEQMQDYVWTNVRKQYISHIPMESIKELPDFYKVYLGGTAYMVMFAVFAYFTYTSYKSAVTEPFMSLQNGQTCTPVPVNVSGTYQADSAGFWYGQQGFDYTKAIYSMQFSFVSGGEDQFAAALNQFKADTEALSAIGSSATLARNMLYWIAYSDTAHWKNDSSSISFQFTGQANVVFNTDYLHGQVGSVNGMCTIQSLTTFDQANSAMKLTFNYTDYSENSACVGAANPYALGYFPTVNQQDFSLSVDVNTFAISSAVNYEIVALNELQEVPGQSLTTTVDGLFNVTFGEFFDPRTPLMDPLICVTSLTPLGSQSSFPPSIKAWFDRISGRPTCFMRFGGMPALPVFRHYGAEQATPLPCSCSTGVGQTATCQEFNLLLSFVFYNYPGNTTATSLSAIKEMSSTVLVQLLLLLNQTASYEDFNIAAYNASWAPISYVYPESSKLTTNKKWRKNAFTFCALESLGVDTYCSVISLNPYSATSKAVSEYFYQLKQASCHDTFSVNESTWTSLQANPPAEFTQNYYECVMDATDALMNAAGIAQGNVATVLPILVVLTLPIMYSILHFIGQAPPKEEYNSDDRKAALHAFAIQLLRLRDGKVRGMKHNGHLLGLGRELMAAAKLEGGYPDSDDSDQDSCDSDDEADDKDGDEDDENGDDKTAKTMDDDEESQSPHPSRRKSKSAKKRASSKRQVDSDDEDDHGENGGEDDNNEALRESLSRAANARTKAKRRSKKAHHHHHHNHNRHDEDNYGEENNDEGVGRASVAPKPRLGDGHIIRGLFKRKDKLAADGPEQETDFNGHVIRRSEFSGSGVANGHSPAGKSKQRSVIVQPRRNNMDIFISQATKDKYRPPPPVALAATHDTRKSMIRNPMSGHSSRFTIGGGGGGVGDVELGKVKHVNMIALNDDVMNNDIKAVFAQRQNEFAGTTLDNASRQLLLHFSDALHTSTDNDATVKSSPQYLEARLLTMALRNIRFDEDDEDVEFAVCCMNLSSALSIHITLQLNCKMAQVASMYGNNVGYNIGGTIYCLNQLKQIGEFSD